MRDKVKEIIAQAVGVESSDLEDGTLLSAIGLGAPEIPELVNAINQEFGVNLPPEEAEQTKTVGEFADLAEKYSQDEL